MAVACKKLFSFQVLTLHGINLIIMVSQIQDNKSFNTSQCPLCGFPWEIISGKFSERPKASLKQVEPSAEKNKTLRPFTTIFKWI